MHNKTSGANTDSATPNTERVVTREFVIVTFSGIFALIGFSSTLPLIPRYVEGELGGTKLEVGIAVGIFAISAVLARPFIGRMGDQRGRRFIIVAGCATTAISVAAHAMAASLPMLYVVRLVMGMTQGAFFVGTATLVNDLAPAHRRAQATSYFSVAIYSGMAFGPLLGETVQARAGFGWAFVAGGGALLVAAGVAMMLPARVPRRIDEIDMADTGDGFGDEIGDGAGPDVLAPPSRWSGLLHLGAIWPGAILFCGIVAFTALNSFMPLYVEEWDLGSAGPVFVVYGLAVLAVRLLGAKVPDRWGTKRATAFALAGQVVGLTVMGAYTTTIGLYGGALILAVGGSMLYPALLTAAVYQVPSHQRAKATSTFSMAFELSAGIAGPALGVAASIGGNRAAFFAAAFFAALGFPLLALWAGSKPHKLIPASA